MIYVEITGVLGIVLGIVELLASIGMIGAAAGVSSMGFKKPREYVRNYMMDIVKEATADEFTEIHKRLDIGTATDITLLRHEITGIYQKYLGDAALPERLKQDLDHLVERYFELGGNSYVKDIYEEMCQWEVYED